LFWGQFYAYTIANIKYGKACIASDFLYREVDTLIIYEGKFICDDFLSFAVCFLSTA